MELKKVECPNCGNIQEDYVENDSHLCEACGEHLQDEHQSFLF